MDAYLNVLEDTDVEDDGLLHQSSHTHTLSLSLLLSFPPSPLPSFPLSLLLFHPIQTQIPLVLLLYADARYSPCYDDDPRPSINDHRSSPFRPLGDESPQRSDDHWAPLLGLDNPDGRATSALIREYVQLHGEAAWAKKEDSLIRYANNFLGGEAKWEDVREDGASSGAWFRWKNQPVEEVAQIMRRR